MLLSFHEAPTNQGRSRNAHFRCATAHHEASNVPLGDEDGGDIHLDALMAKQPSTVHLQVTMSQSNSITLLLSVVTSSEKGQVSRFLFDNFRCMGDGGKESEDSHCTRCC